MIGRTGMELRHLTTFRIVAQLLSFRRAAETLGYVQANVTAHIQALEEELDVRLFDRLGRHIALTDAGKQLLEYADRLACITQEAQAVLSKREGVVKGSVTISAPETLWIYRLPPLMRLFQERFPQVRLLFCPRPCIDLQRSVREGSVDLAFVMEPPLQARGLVGEPLVAEPISLLVAPSHPLAHAEFLGPTDLETETLLLVEVGCGYRTAFEHQLATAGITPQTILEFSSIEALKQCAMLRMGVAVLPTVSVVAEIAQERLVTLPWLEKGFQMVTQIIWHKEKWISPAMQAFLAVTREVIKDAHQ
jgi:DNA-binding transcriptional LysR family regulator